MADDVDNVIWRVTKLILWLIATRNEVGAYRKLTGPKKSRFPIGTPR